MPEHKTESEWRKWLQRRIARANLHKQKTCGEGEIGPGFFADDLTKKPNAQFTTEGKERQAARMKAKNGGIIGICKDSGSSYVVSFPGGQRTRVRCAITGAEIRNAAAEKKYPGIDAFKCDIEAVWERYGCRCGTHKRGKK